MADKIDILIDAKVMYQMYEYAAYAKHIFGTEIAGWGHYNKKDGIYKLTPLPKQIVSGADVDTFPDEILKDQTYDISDMVVQWHSHVDMGVTPSGTDKKLIKDALELYPYLISIIVNCKHQYHAELNIKRSGELVFPDPIHLDVELVTYYDNPEVKKIVKKQCRKPAPLTISTPKTIPAYNKVARTYGWNPHYGMGEYIGDDFYPTEADFYIKNVVWSPLKSCFRKDTTGEIKIFFTKKEANQIEAFPENGKQWGFGKDDLDYFPTAEELKQLNIVTGIDGNLTDYDIKQIKNKAILLDKRYGKDCQMICASDRWAIQHLKTGTYCEIDSIANEVMVQGTPSEWNEFIKRVGFPETDLLYSPGDCVACNATGKSSKGKVCKACEGTGKIKITA